jgi:hypothetical protein
MDTKRDQALKASKEQIIYANLLSIGVWTGIIILLATYFIYLTGILPSHVEVSLIPKAWDKGVAEYLEITHSPHGWGWTSLLMKGDFLNYIGLSLLGLLTIFCYLVLARGFFREKDWIFTTITILEIAVLVLAASGILISGGH